MEKVLGIGGFFFRAIDPQGMARWYSDCLGIDLTVPDRGVLGWQQHARMPMSSPFGQNSAYLASPEKVWMLNFRVRNLDAMIRQLRANGVVVQVDSEIYPNGMFARFADPEGNPVAIWEPQGADARE